MDKPISVGDLVMVVKPLECCGYSGGLGITFRVVKVTDELGRCIHCGTSDQPGPMATRDSGEIAQTWRLKRIPPPDELGIVDEKEELTA